MQSIIMISIAGDMFFFKDNSFTDKQKYDMENLAECSFTKYPNLKELGSKEINSWFMKEIKNRFSINLEPITLTYVIRFAN